MSDMEEGPAYVSGDEVVNLGDCRSETLDVQLLVKENRGDLRACEQVFEVGVGTHQGVVAGLGLLTRGLELLVGRLEFLVHRQQFFVRRLELLVGRLDVLDGSLKIVARRLQLVLEMFDERVGLVVRSARAVLFAIHERSQVLEDQEIETASLAELGHGLDGESDPVDPLLRLDGKVVVLDGATALDRLAQCGANSDSQPAPRQLDDVVLE